MMKRKIVLALALMCTATLFAGDLSISSVSFLDGLGNPVEKDYLVSSYKIVGKNMPNKSTIAGQFSKNFDEIPYTIENLADSDNWSMKVYAYDSEGKLVGQSEDFSVSVKGDSSINVNIAIDVPTFILEDVKIPNDGKYVSVSDVYDVDHYKLTFYSSQGEELVFTSESLPFATTDLSEGKWSVLIEAVDKDGNTISSSSRLSFFLSEKGEINASVALSPVSRKLSIVTEGTAEDNGYLYLEDEKNFKVSASVYPMTLSDQVSYKWYVSKDGEWVAVESDDATLDYGDIKKLVKDQDSFSVLCNPVLNDREYRGSYITLSSIPELVPTLYVTGSKPLTLDGSDSVDVVSTSSNFAFALDIPTYYLGKGVKVYYTLDGSKPTTSSSLLTVGDKISLSSGKSDLKLLLISSDGKEHRYNVTLNITEKVASPSISISNRDRGKDLYATLSTKTDGAKIYYTLDGSEPNENSTEYTEPFKIGTIQDRNKVTLKTIAIKDGYENSDVTSIKGF